MKLYCFDPVVISDTVGTFHTLMFHGKIDREARMAPPNFLGGGPWPPLKVIRNGRHVPEVFEPMWGCNLVVSEAVSRRLASLPNLVQRPVAFTRLFDFPYRAGDFSYVEDLRKLGGRFHDEPDVEGWENEERLYEVVPDVLDLHASIGAYFELIMARLKDVVGKYDGRKSLVFSPQPITGEVTLELSRDLLHDHPVFWNKAYFCTEEAFAAFDPALDRDYFVVKELDVDL